MDQKKIAEQMIQFNKTAMDTGIKAVTMVYEQNEKWQKRSWNRLPDIPLAGLPLIFGVDRLFDMMRTSTNVLGDASCAVIVNRMIDRKTAKS